MATTRWALIVFFLSLQTAQAYDCSTIRSYVTRYGRTAAKLWALQNGYTWAQIIAAQRACFR